MVLKRKGSPSSDLATSNVPPHTHTHTVTLTITEAGSLWAWKQSLGP